MDSSDSEDDCYGNMALKLKRMKNKFDNDRLECSILNDSEEIDETVKSDNVLSENRTKSSFTKNTNAVASDNEDHDIVLHDVPTSSKRVTRSTAKRSSSESNISDAPVHAKPNKRKRGGKTPQKDLNKEKTQENTQYSPRTRGRGRGRGRSRGGNRNINRRNNRHTVINTSWNIPTYSVGNTDEYPDQSDCLELFSSKPKSDDVVIIEDTEALDENEELSVKVYWQSSEYFKFQIRRFQKLTQIFDYFSKKENVSHDKLLFMFNDRILKSDDTPDAINYNIVKFIDGGIVNQSVSKLLKDENNKKDQTGLKIKFQCQNFKKPFETWVKLDEKLSIAMMKCAEHFEMALDRLRFQFDGDSISGKTTPKDLELEGGECIDVKIIS